jgi:hypothetical protein
LDNNVLLMIDNFIIPNPYFIDRFLPLDILKRRKGSKRAFWSMGSLNSLAGSINTGLLPDFETKYDFKAEYQEIILQDSTIHLLATKYGIKTGQVKMLDRSYLKDKIIEYFKNNVKLDKMWRDMFGKDMYIVLTGFYSNSVERTKQTNLFFRSKTSHTTVTTKSDDWIMFGFTCLKMSIKRDGTIGNIEMMEPLAKLKW